MPLGDPQPRDRELVCRRKRRDLRGKRHSDVQVPARANLRPHEIWSRPYRNIGIQKPGQINAGSGTTPTLVGPVSGHYSTTPEYVAITDNADPMDVVVYRTADHLRRGQHRVVCTVPVFNKGASDDENSLISLGRSLIVENN